MEAETCTAYNQCMSTDVKTIAIERLKAIDKAVFELYKKAETGKVTQADLGEIIKLVRATVAEIDERQTSSHPKGNTVYSPPGH